MKRPAFQFYPADWRNNAKLRRCSWAARGVWIDVMSLFHDSEEYGLLRWPLKEIAQAIGAPLSLLKELVDKDVLKGGDKALEQAFVYTPVSGRKKGAPVELVPQQKGPVWFSSRMVTDEHIRQKKGNHELYKDSPHHSPMPPIGDEMDYSPKPPESDLPSSSSTSSVNNVVGSSTVGEGDGATTQTPLARIGQLCTALRRIGVKAAPDAFLHPDWEPLLQRFDNDYIVAVAQAKRLASPEKGITAAYLVPVLRDRLNQQPSNPGVPNASAQYTERNARNAAILREATDGFQAGGDVIEGQVRVVG